MTKPRRLWIASCLAALLGSAVLPCAGAQQPDGDEEGALVLPQTVERVWYRLGKRKLFGGGKLNGDFIVTDEGLELHAGKKHVHLPYEAIRQVTLGKMRGDVNTEWVVLAVDESYGNLLGFRDARKWGFGRRTREIHDLIRAAVGQAAAAQYAVPDGFQAYDEMDRQYTMAFPAGWTVTHDSIVEVDDHLIWGRTIFSEQPLSGSNAPVDGAWFFLDRRDSPGAMACKGLGKKGERLLRDWLDNDPALSVPGERSGEPEVQAAALGDCIGRRALVRYRAEDGTPGLLDLRVVSDDDTVYLFGLQAPEAQHESWRRWFDPAVGSFLPSVAQ